MLKVKDVEEFKEYLSGGGWDEDFECRTPDGQGEMLDFIESLFELCDLADEVLSKRLYRQMQDAMPGQAQSVPVDSD